MCQVDLSELIAVVARVDHSLLLLAFGMHSLGFLFSALRWQKLLESQGVHVRLLPLIDSYLVGSFFNVFMPTRIGGDVVRVSDLRRATESISRSASSVFVERFLGMSVLLVFALSASLLRLPLAQKIPAIWAGIGIALFGLVVLLSSLYLPFLGQLMLLIPLPKLRTKCLAVWQTFSENARVVLSQREPVFWGLWYSFLLQINVVAHFWIIGEALGFGIPLLDYFFLIPVQLVVLMLPAINGIGLREASSIVLFGFYGIAATEAATFGLIDLAMMFALGLVGSFRYLFRRSIPESYELGPRTSL